VLPIILTVFVAFGRHQSSAVIPAFSGRNFTIFCLITRHIQRVPDTFKYAIITGAGPLASGFTIAYYLAFHIRTQTWADKPPYFCCGHDPILTQHIIRMIQLDSRFWAATGIPIRHFISWALVDDAAGLAAV